MLVRAWLTELGVAEATIAALEERYPTQRILQQLEWLRYRNPRDPAAMLVRAVQGNWDPPAQAPGKELAGSRVRSPDDAEQAPREPPWSVDLAGEPASWKSLSGAGWSVGGTAVDVRDAWAQLLSEIRLQMTRVTFDTWLGGTEVAGVHGNVVSVLVRDGYAAEWLQARWQQPIERTMSGIVGCPVTVHFLGPNVLE